MSISNLNIVILVPTSLGLDKAFALFNGVAKLLHAFAKIMLAAVPIELNVMPASASHVSFVRHVVDFKRSKSMLGMNLHVCKKYFSM